MTKLIKKDIYCIYKSNKINMMDIYAVQREALNLKMYELVVYINRNWQEYISFIKLLQEESPWE